MPKDFLKKDALPCGKNCTRKEDNANPNITRPLRNPFTYWITWFQDIFLKLREKRLSYCVKKFTLRRSDRTRDGVSSPLSPLVPLAWSTHPADIIANAKQKVSASCEVHRSHCHGWGWDWDISSPGKAAGTSAWHGLIEIAVQEVTWIYELQSRLCTNLISNSHVEPINTTYPHFTSKSRCSSILLF